MKKKRLNLYWGNLRTKMLLSMKLTVVLTLLSAFTVFGGSLDLNSKLSLKVQDRQIKEVLNEIENQSNYSFMYDNKKVDVERSVSLDVQGKAIEEVLADVFAGTNVTYRIIDRHIMLMEKDVPGTRVQTGTVKGSVVSENGEPLPGVAVVVKGTTVGTITDFDGNFSLSGVSSTDVLQFTFIGMQPQEIPVGSQTTFTVTMKEETIGVEEVVVVGFGTQKKVNLTGAVGVVDSEKLADRPVQNASQMLQGLVSGLNISSSGGSLEDSPNINIRGVATIGEGSTGSPLVLIDGMESSLDAVNPQDIESISVLKDAAASSIYGSRAPFGVILVTTKKGTEGKTIINYNNNFRWSSPINMPDMMDSYTYALYFNEALTNNGEGLFFTPERLQLIQDYQNGLTRDETLQSESNPQFWGDGYGFGIANNDWYDVIYKDYSFSQEHNVSVSGGSKAVQYYASGNFLDQSGLMEFNTDKFKRYTSTIKLQAELTDWATVSVSNRWIREDFGRPSQLNEGMFTDLARQGWPMLPLYDPNGNILTSPSPALSLRDGGRDTRQTDRLFQQGKLVLEPIKDWLITGEVNYRTVDEFRHWDVQTIYNHDVDGNAFVTEDWRGNLVHERAHKSNYLNTNLFTEYTKEVGDGHNFKGLIGYQSELYKNRYFSAQRDGIMVPSIPTINTTSGTDIKGETTPPEVEGYYEHWSTKGFFGRLNYNYKERYLIEGNLRYDGTSRFRSDKRWNWFPSVSAGWNIAREPFWASMEQIIGTMKLRGSWGELGNQNTEKFYPTYVTMPVGIANGNWLVNGAQPNTASAPELVSQSLFWETVRSWDIGLDMSFFRNKLSASFDYYTRYTKNMVGPAPELPAILGADVPEINNTDLKTYGFEFDVTWRDRLKNGLGYSVHVLLSDSQTEITKYPNPTGALFDEDGNDRYLEGRKLGEIWGYETIDIARYAGEMEAHLASLPNGGQDAIGSKWDQGDIMYRDLNNDDRIDNGAATLNNHGDLKVIGNSTARFPFSVDLAADWKGFDVRAFFQGVLKRDFYLNSYYFWGAWDWGIWWSTGLEEHEDYYRAGADNPLGQNVDAYYPRPMFGSQGAKNHQTQTAYLQDASYIRLKNLQFGYTLPASFTQRMGIEKLRVYVSGENVWTGTKMSKVFDPELTQNFRDDRWTGNNYPLNRTLSLGLSVNF